MRAHVLRPLTARLKSTSLGLAAAALATGLAVAPARAAAGDRPAEVELKDGFPVTSPQKLYPFSRIQRGDRGIGYTVFAEDKISTFQVEILGVMESMLGPKRDVILARLSGPEVEFSGVVAGMSGSPVYIDGMLVGAVSYRFGAFTKEPIAGITPIESMLDVWKSEEIEPPRPEALTMLPSAVPSGERPTGAVRVSDFRDRALLPRVTVPKLGALGGGPYDALPIETPVQLVGFEPSVAEELSGALKEAGFVTAAGGAAGASRRGLAPREGGLRKVEANERAQSGRVKAAPIAPGAPIAAVLMRGDMYVAATGTVTFVDGKQVLGFGHPFLGFGHVTFPMATASILNTLATPLGSYKMGSTALEVGAITHDRLTTIAGSLGGSAPMVPVHIRVERADAAGKKGVSTADVEIVKDGMWLPILTDAVISSAAMGRLGYEAGGTVDLKVGVDVGDRRLEFSDTYSAEPPYRVSAFAARDVATAVGMVAKNNLAPVDIRGVDVELRVRSTVELATIEQVVPDRAVVRPGEKLGLTARLRPYKKDPVNVRLSVDIPSDVTGEIEVYVGGSVELDRRDGEVYGDRYPTDVDQLLGILAERRPARALYARVYVPRAGLRTNAELLSSLPPSQRASLGMDLGRVSKTVSESFGPSATLPHPDVVVGSQAISVSVVR